MKLTLAGIKPCLFTFAIVITVISGSHAQFNDTTHYFVSYASTGSINRTSNSKSNLLNNQLKFSVRRNRLLLNTASSWIYGKQNAVKTNDDYSTNLDFNYLHPHSRFYYWGLFNFDKSYSLKINHRMQTGLGVAYNIIDRATGSLTASDGFIYELADLIDPEIGNVNYETVRNSFRIKFHLRIKKDLLAIDGSNFYQPSLKDSHDYIIKSNTSLSLKLNKWLNFTTAVVYNKISFNKRENFLFTFGLTMQKYF